MSDLYEAKDVRQCNGQSPGSLARGYVDYQGKCPKCGKWSASKVSNIIGSYTATCEWCETEFRIVTP